MMQQPYAYTSKEGGVWQDWPKTAILKKKHLKLYPHHENFVFPLDKKQKNSEVILIHSLIFDHPMSLNCPRWDLWNG